MGDICDPYASYRELAVTTSLIQLIPHRLIKLLTESANMASGSELGTDFGEPIRVSANDGDGSGWDISLILWYVLFDFQLQGSLLILKCSSWIFSDVLSGQCMDLNVK